MEKIDKTKIDKIAEKYRLKLAILFGSQATGKAHKGSDTDVAVLGEKKLSFEDIINLNNELAEAFQTREIDVKSLHNSDPLFRYQVMRNGKLLYGKNYDYHSFKAYAFRDFVDSRDIFDLKEIMVRKRVESLNV